MAQFDDLPLITDGDEARRIHNTTALFFLSKTLTAHRDLDCSEIRSVDWIVNNPNWRRATDAEVRGLGGGWCSRCCSV